MAATPPKPNLLKSTALVQGTTANTRLTSLMPTVQSPLSPVTVYQAGTLGVGKQLTAPTSFFPAGAGYYGVWTAPNLNSGKPYTIQVECFGGGGGGGGGSTTSGGGGGGGGEYASEVHYPVKPGTTYAWQVGVPGSPGTANTSSQLATAGGTGGTTIFDIAGLGIAGGVVANGGQGGDVGNTGNGGLGGKGSGNSVEFGGGAGGINLPGGGGGSGGQGGTDNPVSLFTAGLLTHPALAWYVLNDSSTSGYLNDNTGNGNVAQPGSYAGGGLSYAQSTAPTQVPAYSGSASPPSRPNATTAASMIRFNLAQLNQQSGYILMPGLELATSQLTISGWIQPDPTAVWGNTSNGSVAMIACNNQIGSPGVALYLQNNGTPSNPSWQLNFYAGNGSNSNTISTALTPVANTPVYVVATFSSGSMILYVNKVSSATGSAGFSTLPDWPTVPYAYTLGSDPTISKDWFFGYMSNFWFAPGVLSSAGVSQAYSGTGAGPGTGGGAGGGASGGLPAIGGAGAAGSGSNGGAGGTPATLPTADIGLNTPASAGIAGANNATSNAGITGSYGAGGGGAGESSAPPSTVTVTVPFTTAAAYCGTDASGGAAGTVYNPVISGTTGRLFTGGQSADAASGSKNSLLILPPGLAAQLQVNNFTVLRVTLTVFNANTRAKQAALMQVGWSTDTFLPITYTAGDITGSAGVLEIPAGAYSVTADLTESQLGSYLQGGAATALVLGPGASPTFAAYNATTAGDFYTAIYGPGAVDSAGNSLAPYLTITYATSTTVQQGSAGGPGGILLTYLNQSESLVGTWNSGSGIHAQGGQMTETTLVLGSTLLDAMRLGEAAAPPPMFADAAVQDAFAFLGRLQDAMNSGRLAEQIREAIADGRLPAGRLGGIDGAPGTVLGYTATPTTVTQTAAGNYTFTVPAGITSLSVACWGAGAGATGGSTSQGQGGGGGGAYAAEASYPCNPGDVIHYTVGAGGTGTAVGTSGTPDGGATTFDTTFIETKTGVVANGGQHYQAAFNYGPGGAISNNTTSFAGGNGGPINFNQSNGSGGGGAAGSAANGGQGSQGGGAGAGGSVGGGAGGAGHGSNASGSNGTAPGGGGGGAGKGTSAHSGGNGAAGKITITYLASTSLLTSIATTAGSDAAGNSYPTGVMTNALQVNGAASTTGNITSTTGNISSTNGNISANNGTVSANTLSGSLNGSFVTGSVANANNATNATTAANLTGLSIPQSRAGGLQTAPSSYTQSWGNSVVSFVTQINSQLGAAGVFV